MNNMKDHITEQGEKLITVYIQDKDTQEIVGIQTIKRALLAKHFHEHRVLGAKDGLFVIEI